MSHVPIIGGLLSAASNGVAKLALDAVSTWVLAGTKSALEAVAKVVGTATSPNLLDGWFSTTYFRVAGLAALLTVPFLFAAALQALLRSDLALLVRAALFDLPVAVLGVFIAAPLVMMLLAATDEMCAIVSNGGSSAAGALDRMALGVGGISAVSGSAFLAVLMGVIAALAAVGLMIELLIRAAAVYAVMLMLPLTFAALVWPARRIWAQRTVELLLALILSKFAIVAILSLAAAGIAAAGLGGAGGLLIAMTLLILATFSPWALLKLLPFTEVAAGAATMLRSEGSNGLQQHARLLPAGVDDFNPIPDMLRQLQSEPRGASPATTPSPSGMTRATDARTPAPEPANGTAATSTTHTGSTTHNATDAAERAASGSIDPATPSAPANASAIPPETPTAESPRGPSLEEEVPILHPDNGHLQFYTDGRWFSAPPDVAGEGEDRDGER